MMDDILQNLTPLLNDLPEKDGAYGTQFNCSCVYNPDNEQKYSMGVHIKDSTGLDIDTSVGGNQLGDVLNTVINDIENKRKVWTLGDSELLKTRLRERDARISTLEKELVTQHDHIRGLNKYIAELESMVKPAQSKPQTTTTTTAATAKQPITNVNTTDDTKRISSIFNQFFNN